MAKAGTVIGLDEFNNHLSRISGIVSGTIMRSGMSKAATAIKRVMRANVNAVPVNTEHGASVKKGVRQTLGHHTKKDPTHGYILRVGFGVGIRGASRLKRQSAGTTKGKGISAKNVHWFVLGAGPPKRRGVIDPFFAGVIANSVRDAGPTAATALIKGVNAAIQREATKKKSFIIVYV
jgi:hypothetical protein